jgi:hypothetical protein
MMAAISPNFDRDQSSNFPARTTYEFRAVCDSFAFLAKPKALSPVG